MQRFTEGDPVRIDIPDEKDPDHKPFHGKRGIVTEVFDVYTSLLPEGERERTLYRIRLDDGTILDFDTVLVRPP